MPDEFTPTETTTETVVETPVEVDIEKATDVSQVRDWGKGWQTSAQEYEPAHKFLSENYGGSLEQAELGHSVFNALFSEKFDPQSFLKVVEQISPNRSKQLIENFATEEAKKLIPSQLKELFGSEVSKEDAALFKSWKESGMFGKADDLPEFLKFDKDGNPRSEEELKFFRDMQSQVKSVTQSKDQEKAEKERLAYIEKEQKVEQDIQSFADGRLNTLRKEFDTFPALKFDASDTEDIRLEKTILRKFVEDGLAGVFMAGEGKKNYDSAIAFIENGEPMLARKYESLIEADLIKLFRSNTLEKLLSSIKGVVSPDPDLNILNDKSGREKVNVDEFDLEDAKKKFLASVT